MINSFLNVSNLRSAFLSFFFYKHEIQGIYMTVELKI